MEEGREAGGGEKGKVEEEKQEEKKSGRETLVRESGGAVLLPATGCQCVHTVRNATGVSCHCGVAAFDWGVRMRWESGEGGGAREARGGSSAR